MSICEHMIGSCESSRSALKKSPEEKLNIQNELVWGLSYRNYKENEKNRPIKPIHSPINIPFEICRAELLLKKRRPVKAITREDDTQGYGDGTSGLEKPKTKKRQIRTEKPSLLERSVWSQNKYMDYLSIPNLKFEEPKLKKFKRRCELEPCPPRFVQLAVPNKRKVFANWKEYAHFLPTEMLMRYEEILHTDQNLEPREARYYYKKLDRQRQKELKKKKKSEKKKQKDKDKVADWRAVQVELLANDILEYIKDEPLFTLNYKQMLLSDGILERLDATGIMKKPSRKTKNHYKKTVIEVADKFAIWIDTLTRFVDVQAIESDEDIPPLSLASLSEEGEGEGSSDYDSSSEEELRDDQLFGPEDATWDEEGGEGDVGHDLENVLKDIFGIQGGEEGDADFDDILNDLDADILTKLINILSNCPDDFLNTEIDEEERPGVKYIDVLNKLKALKKGMTQPGGDKSFLEQIMIDWALRNDPDKVDDALLKKIHEVAALLDDWLLAGKPGEGRVESETDGEEREVGPKGELDDEEGEGKHKVAFEGEDGENEGEGVEGVDEQDGEREGAGVNANEGEPEGAGSDEGPGAGSGADPGEGPGAGPGEGPGEGPGAGPGEDLGAGLGEDPGAGPGEDPGAGPGEDPGEGPGAGPGADPGVDLDAGPGAGPGAGPDADPVTGPDSGPGAGPGTGEGEYGQDGKESPQFGVEEEEDLGGESKGEIEYDGGDIPDDGGEVEDFGGGTEIDEGKDVGTEVDGGADIGVGTEVGVAEDEGVPKSSEEPTFDDFATTDEAEEGLTAGDVSGVFSIIEGEEGLGSEFEPGVPGEGSAIGVGEDGLPIYGDFDVQIPGLVDEEGPARLDEAAGLDGKIIKGHKPSKVFEHSPDTVCCLSLKTWAVWLLEITHNAHNWTQWMSCVIQKVREYASIVRGDVKLPNGETKVLRKQEWRDFIKETEENVIAWRQYSSHVKDLSQSIVENFHGKEVNCCPKCLQDHLIKNVVVAHDTLQALTEAINCAAYWQRCLDTLVEKTCSLTETAPDTDGDAEGTSEESECEVDIEEVKEEESGESVYEIEGIESNLNNEKK